MKNKPIHDSEHLSEKQWFEQVMANREKAQEAGNLAVVARCDELVARRLNIIPERGKRRKELDTIERQEVRILAMLRLDPRVKLVVDEIRDKIAGKQAVNNDETGPVPVDESAPGGGKKAAGAGSGKAVTPPSPRPVRTYSPDRNFSRFGANVESEYPESKSE
jgi:hypothetical protein